MVYVNEARATRAILLSKIVSTSETGNAIVRHACLSGSHAPFVTIDCYSDRRTLDIWFVWANLIRVEIVNLPGRRAPIPNYRAAMTGGRRFIISLVQLPRVAKLLKPLRDA